MAASHEAPHHPQTSKWCLHGLHATCVGAGLAAALYIQCVQAALSHRDDFVYCANTQGPQMRQYELEELTKIYEDRGLPSGLAKEVAMHLTKNDGG